MACIESPAASTKHDSAKLRYPQGESKDSNTMTCIVCWEKTQKSATTTTTETEKKKKNNDTEKNRPLVTLSCNHGACQECITSWIRRCEDNGHDVATCPQCRQVMESNIIQHILGRPYQRVSQQPTADDAEVVVDDFILTWLSENGAQECPNCGMFSVRETDGDQMPATACLCGFIYCWDCKNDAVEECECDHHRFYDNLTDRELKMSDASDYPVATGDDLHDLQEFLERRKAAICGYNNASDNNENAPVGNENDGHQDGEEENTKNEDSEEAAQEDGRATTTSQDDERRPTTATTEAEGGRLATDTTQEELGDENEEGQSIGGENTKNEDSEVAAQEGAAQEDGRTPTQDDERRIATTTPTEEAGRLATQEDGTSTARTQTPQSTQSQAADVVAEQPPEEDLMALVDGTHEADVPSSTTNRPPVTLKRTLSMTTLLLAAASIKPNKIQRSMTI